MKIVYLGANRRVGVSEKTGNPYDIAELVYTVPDEPSQKVSDDGRTIWNYIGFGHKVRTLPLQSEAIGLFESVVPGKVVEVNLEPNPMNPTRNHVTGLA